MKNKNPQNTLVPNSKNLLIADKFLDFQRLIMKAHSAELKRRKSIEILVPVTEPERFQKKMDELQTFFEWITDREIKFKFSKIPKTKQQRLSRSSFDFVSSFSGGLDSLSYPLLQNNIQKKGLLSHTITSLRMQGVARKVWKNVLPRNHRMVETNLDLTGAADIPLLHVRGVVFLTSLLCLASEYSVNQVAIPENGPFMINYPVSTRVDPTRTTNLAMIAEWTKIFNDLTGQSIKVQTPFFNYTKSEVILIANSPDSVMHTWSCSTSQGNVNMCGLCMACFVRILSLYAIDQGEDLKRTYDNNVMTLSTNSLGPKKKDSFRILIDCVEFWKYLIHPDLAPTSLDQDKYKVLIKRHSVMKNHAIEMYIGLENCLKANNRGSALVQLVERNLKIIDSSMLNARRSQLENRINSYGAK